MIHRSASLLFLLSLIALPAYPQLVISQIYGGGGNAGASYKNDFIEVFNIGPAPVSLTGYSVQYAAATGTTWQVTNLTGTLGPGKYYLIHEAPGTGGTTDLPAPDATGTIAMSATAGKVALVAGTNALNGACPTADIIDLIGFGPTANCFEGTAPAPAPSNTLGDLRAASGCTDTNSNPTDFTAAAPIPRNTAATPNACVAGVTGPGATGAASVNPVISGNATTLTATNIPGLNPPSLTFTDTCSLTPIGGALAVKLPVSYVVPALTPPGTYPLACTVTDEQNRSGSFTLTLTVEAPPPVFKRISEINGTGIKSPFAGVPVQTRGVVTAIRGATTGTRGFYLESLPADRDTDPATSEGLLVFIGSAALPACAVTGNYVRIDGTLQDFVSATAPIGSTPLTELSATSNCQVLETGALTRLPAAVAIDSTTLSPTGSGNQARRLLAMRVTLTAATVVGPTLGTITETSAQAVTGSNFFVTAQGTKRPFHSVPGIQETRRPADAPATVPSWNGNPEALRVDPTGLTGGTTYEVATGTTIAAITGIMDFNTSQGQYQILTNPAGLGAFSPATPSLAATPIPLPLPSDLLIVNANLERFYDTVNNGGDVVLTSDAYKGRLNKLSLAIRNIMRMPDIIAFEEVEGPPSSTSSPRYPVLTDITNKLNADAAANGQGSPNYGFCGGVTNDSGLISAAAIYRQDRVSAVECTQYGIDTTSPTPGGGNALLNDRPPVVLRANVKATGSDSGIQIRLVVNHLRSLSGIDEPGTAAGDRVRSKRNDQARYLGNLLAGRLGSEQNANWTATDNLIVAGDMNAFEVNDGYSDSVNCIAGSPAPANQIYATAAQLAASAPCAAIPGLSLTNLTTTDPAQRYSYSFSGTAQRIDHILIGDKLTPRLRQFAYVRNNADFPEGPTYRNNFNRPERYSDHDAPAAYFTLPMEVTGRSTATVSGLYFNRATRRYNGTLTVTNTGNIPLAGPLYVFFSNLPAGVTLPWLPLINGQRCAVFTLPAPLAPGSGTTGIPITFANPHNVEIRFTTKTFDATF